MAQPLPYERDYDFEFFQSQHPATPLPGDKVNLELDQVAETFDQVLDRIRRLQRDDLALASKSVGYDQLKDEVSLGFNPPTAWETATAYIRSDSVFADNGFYRCIVSHTSGDFEADLAVGKWELVADFTSATTEAQAAQAAAEAARDAAVVAKNGAESARDTAVGASAAAGTSADNAALSAGTATSAAATATGARDAALSAQSGAESARDAAVVARNDAQAAAVAADASADAAAISEANAAATLAGALVKTNNLSDVADAATSRENIGVEAATRTILKAMPASPTGRIVHLLESGREGKFRLKAGSIPVTDTYEGWFIASNTASFYWERICDYVYCDDFGPAADGTTSDHLVLTAAAKIAAYLKKALVLCRGGAKVYAIEDNWEITNGVVALLHGGGTVKFTHTASTFKSILLKGVHSGESANVSDCLVRMNLDCNAKYSWGITGENCSRVTFHGCRVFNNTNVGYCLHVHAYEDGGGNAFDNKFIGNTLYSSTATPTNSTFGIMLWADSAGSADMPTYWKANHSVPDPTYWIWRTTIVGNTIAGGHYAISGNSAIETAVAGNVCANNIRSMSFQNNSHRTAIGANVCREFYSTCIHLAYGTSDCLVEGITGWSSIAVGEGSLQSYVGTKRNTFRGNKITTTGTGPRYYAYAAIDIEDIVYDGNEFTGPCVNAYIAIESGWVETPTNAAQRSSGAGSEDYSSVAVTGVEITNNTIRGTSAVPAVFLSQVQRTLKGVVWSGNKYKTTTVSKVLELYETNSGDLADIVANDNTYPPSGIGTGKFTFPRGRAHFAAVSGRLFSEGPDVIGFTASDLTPSVGVGRIFSVNASGTGSITMFDDGMDGQEITVRLAANSNGITHNTSNIRLKGGSNITTVDSNSWIHLRRVGGIWFETGRSF